MLHTMRKRDADQLLRKVKRDYNAISDEFDQTRSKPWFEFDIYKEMLNAEDKVLDLGCGNGRLFDHLADRDIKYVGVDVSEGLLKAAARSFKGKKLGSSALFKQGSFLSIPYKRPYFDKVICVASFHHIPSRKYRLKALAEIKRVLKPDGTVAISVWNLWQKKYRKYIWQSLLNLNKYDFGDCFIPWGDTGVNRYYHAFSVYEMRTLLRDAGFYIVDEVFVDNKTGIVDDFWRSHNMVFIAKPMINENA